MDQEGDDPVRRSPTAVGASAFRETFTWSDNPSGFPFKGPG